MSQTSEALSSPSARARPTSPHLSIYRPQITSVLSIFHRFTGIALTAGLLFLTWWMLAILYGPNAYGTFLNFTRSIPGQIFLWGWSWSLFYHMLNGIRHLFWDMGKGYKLETVTQSGIMVLVGSVLFTALLWLLACSSLPQNPGVMYG